MSCYACKNDLTNLDNRASSCWKKPKFQFIYQSCSELILFFVLLFVFVCFFNNLRSSLGKYFLSSFCFVSSINGMLSDATRH